MKKQLITLLLGGGLALGACTPLDSPAVPATRTEAPTMPKPEELSKARPQIAGHLRSGRYQAALDVIDQERRRSGSHESLVEEQLQVLSKLSGAAAEFFEAGEYERSGRALRLLLNHFPREQSIAARLGVKRQDLQNRLELCAERLMAQGLVEYRAGNLPVAIATWKKVLAFHDSHAGAKKGIRTAEIQLQNLRALP
jgi:hypothetical protein